MTTSPPPSQSPYLKPCPCCCGPARLVHPHSGGSPYVTCTVCYLASLPGEHTVARWNQRPPAAAPYPGLQPRHSTVDYPAQCECTEL